MLSIIIIQDHTSSTGCASFQNDLGVEVPVADVKNFVSLSPPAYLLAQSFPPDPDVPESFVRSETEPPPAANPTEEPAELPLPLPPLLPLLPAGVPIGPSRAASSACLAHRSHSVGTGLIALSLRQGKAAL